MTYIGIQKQKKQKKKKQKTAGRRFLRVVLAHHEHMDTLQFITRPLTTYSFMVASGTWI